VTARQRVGLRREAPRIVGDATKRLVGDRRHRVIELWAEEKAKSLAAFKSVVPTPEGVVEVYERTFSVRGRSYKPRWELVAAIVAAQGAS
jgi:hypothetical protein